MKHLNHAWRLFATAISFIAFGIGGLFIGLFVMPYLIFRHPNPIQRREKAQYLIHRIFKGFVGLMQTLGVMRLHVKNLEKLHTQAPTLVVANHPCLLDVVCLLSLTPQADCIVKQALWHNPFTRGPVQAAHYILNRQSDQLVTDCAQRLHGHNKLIVFPEGTRTENQTLLNEFQRGAAHIAIASEAVILPIVIRCEPRTLGKHQAWYHIPPRRFDLFLDVQDALDVTPWRELNVTPSVQVRRLNAYLYDYFLRKLSHE